MQAVYQLKITLKGITPPIWRRVLVPDDLDLAQLHHIFQVVMGWGDYHMHEFVHVADRQRRCFVSREYLDELDGPGLFDEQTVRLHQLLSAPKDRLIYYYDFGDGWRHDVVLEKVQKADADTRAPVCLKGKRACPPEDCGGPNGYGAIEEILEDPEHEEYESTLEWLGGDYDAEAFDLDAVNEVLGGVDWGER